MSSPRFACDQCGKTYPWKQDFAGKRAKCACGNIMQVPLQLAPPADADSLDALYDLAPSDNQMQQAQEQPSTGCPECGAALPADAVLCVKCGFNLRTGGKVKTAASERPAKSKAAKSTAYPTRGQSAESAAPTQVMELWLPVGLLAAGIGISLWQLIRLGISPPTAGIYFSVSTVIDMAVIFAGCLVAVKWMGISLGEPIRALLKIGALSVATGAIADVVTTLTGVVYFGWATSLVLYLVMLKVFFELDGGETLLVAGLIWAVRNFVGVFLASMLLSGMLNGVQIPSATLFGGGGLATVDDGSDPTDDQVRKKPTDDDDFSKRLIRSGNFMEAREYIKEREGNGFNSLDRAKATALVEELYKAGAVGVFAADLESAGEGKTNSSVIVIELPADKSARAALFKLVTDRANQYKGKPPRDIGQKYLRLIPPRGI